MNRPDGQLLADRAFAAKRVREALDGAGIEAVVSLKSSRRFPAEFDCDTCKWPLLIEHLFAKLEQFRGIATRCCRTDSSFSAFTALAATVIRRK